MINVRQAGLLKIKIYGSRESLGQNAAQEVALKIRKLLQDKEEVNMVFASAPSQDEFLKSLLEEAVEWDRINAFHLDEYIGLDKKAPQSFGYFIKARLFGKVNLKSANYLDGNVNDIGMECDRYARLLDCYPADIICLGIGENGHLAFNDPGTTDFSDPRKVKAVILDERCRQQQVNDGCFASIAEVPVMALTMTIPAILSGMFIYAMVPGQTKSEAVYRTVTDCVSPACPSTVLRRKKNTVLFTDIDSASHLLATERL
jgi:glucosamine-6-phosphate deaminase